MKLITLNTHSFQENDYQQKLEWFVEGILQERPDVIALQECSQSCGGKLADAELWEGQFAIPARVPLRADNYGAQVAYRLRQAGIDCYWAWIPVKKGYGRYEEGVALLSLGRKIKKAEACFISETTDPENWRTRAVLGIKTEGREDWFYSVHMGWWQDEEEPFIGQWERLKEHLQGKDGQIWLMGDFNAPDDMAMESYDCILQDGWKDACRKAKDCDCGNTVAGNIDGWQEKSEKGMRLDHIFCRKETEICRSAVIFDGRKYPVVSDHFGVMIQTKEGKG